MTYFANIYLLYLPTLKPDTLHICKTFLLVGLATIRKT